MRLSSLLQALNKNLSNKVLNIAMAAIGRFIAKYDTMDGFVIISRPTRSSGFTYIFGEVSEGKYKIIQIKSNKDSHWQYWDLLSKGSSMTTKVMFDRVEERYKELALLKSVKEMNKIDFARTMLVKERLYEQWFRQYFPELADIFEKEDAGLKIDKLTVITQTELKPKEVDELKELIATTTRFLKTINMEKLLYGRIYIVSTLGRAIADYQPSTDVIRVSKAAKKEKKDVLGLLHELAHRAWYQKMLNTINIERKFWEESSRIKINVNVGDKFIDEKNRHLEVIDKKWGRGIYYVVKFDDIQDKKFRVTPDLFLQLKRKSGEPVADTAWFPTAYSKKNASEWFSEVFGYGLINNNADYITFIKGVLK